MNAIDANVQHTDESSANEPMISVEELKTKLYLVTVRASKPNETNATVKFQCSDLLIAAPDVRCACDIADEQFVKNFEVIEITKVQQVEKENGTKK